VCLHWQSKTSSDSAACHFTAGTRLFLWNRRKTADSATGASGTGIALSGLELQQAPAFVSDLGF